MRTASTNKKVREIITSVKEEKLIPRPEFQRRLVWTIKDKNLFLDSILKGYPFPEIYLADGDVDLQTGEGTQLLVDGLQRVSTMVQYFDADPQLVLTSVPQYKDLSENEKRDFLQYDVSVRDLGSISKAQIIEIFRRINATKYSLNDIEINNAVYAGALRQFADRMSGNPFFTEHSVFSAQDFKRMGDLRFALQIIISVMAGYGNRDDMFEDFLSRYNEFFDKQSEIESRILGVLDFIEECGFYPKSRVWRKADLLTLLVELDKTLNEESLNLDPLKVVADLQGFYESIDSGGIGDNTLPGIYYKAALQASNDRVNRVRRGMIVGGILRGENEKAILGRLRQEGLA
jgi:Protein of unknown function DUF262